jgi:hypothetical protein
LYGTVVNTPLLAPGTVVTSISISVREKLEMENRIVPYTFLIDGEGKIRWKSVGKASKEEITLVFSNIEKIKEGK